MEVPFALNAANTFTGTVEIRRGSVYLGHNQALDRGNSLSFNPAAGHQARLFLYGRSARVSDLASTGPGSALIANGNRKTGATLTLGAVTLTVTQSRDTTFGGEVTDAYAEYTGSGSGSTGPLHLLKDGPATLRLTGTLSHSGTTTIADGTLQLDGVAGPGGVLVRSGGTLSGSGVLNSSLSIESGGTLAPGANGLGTITVNGPVTLAGGTTMEIAKVGTSLLCDQLTGMSSLGLNGTLTVSQVNDPRTGALAAAETFTLFEAGTYTGSFSNLSLPALASGLGWDSSNLAVNGSLTVIGLSAVPLLVREPQPLTVAVGESALLTVVAAGPRPITYQWQKNGTAIAAATASGHLLENTITNDAGDYTVVVANSFGSVTSRVAVLTVLPAGPATTITNGLVVYLNFDGTLKAQAGTTNSGSLYTGGATSGPRYKPGVIKDAASFNNTPTAGQPNDWAVSLGNLDWIYAGSFSVSLWERTATSADGALVGNKNWSSGANVGWVISSLESKNVNWNAVGGTRRDVNLNPPFSDKSWHLITVTFNRSANQVISYVDGVPVNTSDISPSGSASLSAGFSTLVGSSGNGTYAAAAEIDDLGIWTRVLTPQEITGIYGAGLRNQPLSSAQPGEAPVIAKQPESGSLAAGSSATLSVALEGPGPFFYQWRLNGISINGATNSTLVLPQVNAANAGAYTVVVSNGAGAIVSTAAVLSVYELAVTGQWDFDQGDLRATVGSDLEYLGETATRTAFPFVAINGRTARALRFDRHAIRDGFYVRHGAQPNGGGRFVNQYTLILDLMFPLESTGRWRALLQSDPFNHEGNDAELYVGNQSASPNPNGLGTGGEYHGSLLPGVWHRVVLAVDLAAPSGEQLTTYIDGAKVGSQSLAGGLDGRYSLGPAFLLFTSGTGNGEFTAPGFLNSLQFINGRLSSAAVAALGGPNAAGLPPGNAAVKIETMSQNASQLTLSWTGPPGEFQVQRSTNLVESGWQTLVGRTTNRNLSIPLSDPTAFFRIQEFQPDLQVGQRPAGEQVIPSKQILRAAGHSLQFAGRPVDLALSPDRQRVYVKNINSLLVLDAASWRIVQTLNYPGNGASMHGIAVSPDGTHVYVTGSGNELYDWRIGTDGLATFVRTIALPGGSAPCGLALSTNGATAYVCLSILNTLAAVNLANGTVTRQTKVGIAPWDVALSPDGTTAYVSDWGGRFPRAGEPTATSAGTPVLVDHRGVAASGVISFVDLASGSEIAQVATGLHPSDLELSADGTTLYVANANSDTVSVVDTATRQVKETVLVRPDPTFPYGSAATGLALSDDGQLLFVATAGINAIAVLELPNASHTNTVLRGFIPTDWYPGALASHGRQLYAVNVKGLGSRLGQPANTTWQIGSFLGTANRIPFPDAESLSKMTAQVFEDGRIPHIRQTQRLLRPNQPPVPVPARVGEPSVFRHVLYILKENKTYDQIFGDLPQGNGDPNLCIFPDSVSPNHHALARQFVLLDNFYCNGVNSSDGHSWSTEANNTDHLEKSFGGFVRSYSFGDDPLTYSSTGFIWNNVLEHGLTFRNYGEMDYASTSPAATWLQLYNDYLNHRRTVRWVQNIGIESLRRHSSTNVPGWNLNIPDVLRAEGFIQELNQAQAAGSWESFHLLYLSNDHTGGPPSPRAQVADNDLALGQVVEAVSKSMFWSNTVIFVIEDDPQSGYDHVDGHRSICLVISPYTKRGEVISTFYNQAGVLHTMERILGLPPMNQQDAMAPLMSECFTTTPDFTPYRALPNNVPLTEGVATTGALTPKDKYWAKKLQQLDLSRPDLIDEDVFNRYIWYRIKGDAPYPAAFVGGHGKGLKKLGLTLDPHQSDED
jgi:YVTN family beta-propeller protein/autotransporter-associated beta strand protein